MLKKPGPEQTAIEMVTLDRLVPKDHLLRKIDAVIDFWFIHDLVSGLYCSDNGRPALDPTLMFKAPFLASCTSNAKSERTITRHVWADARERVDAHRLTDWGRRSTSGARRRWSAPSPTPNSCSATATPASAASSA